MRGREWMEERLSPPRREPDRPFQESVVAKARSLIRLAAGSDPAWKPPPYDPERYAALLGVRVIRTPELRDWDALLVPVPGKETILLNTSVRSSARIRFSLAHELAHLFFRIPAVEPYLLRAENKDKYYATDEARWLERMCDIGAAELILPHPEFRAAMSRSGFRASSIRTLAEEFGASREAVGLRMVETGDADCAVAFFEYSSPPSAEKKGREAGFEDFETVAYRVRRSFGSSGFPFLFPRWKSVPRTSVIYQCSLGRAELAAEEVFRLGGREARLLVTAFPLHLGREIEGPPTVCATFRTIA